MNKRLKKKKNTYRPLTSKQRLKNQAKTIRQLTIENRDLNMQLDALVAVKDQEVEEIQNDVDALQMFLSKQIARGNGMGVEISRLQAQLALPWWKKVFKCK